MHELVTFDSVTDNKALCIVFIIMFFTWCIHAIITIHYNNIRKERLEDIQEMIERGHARRMAEEADSEAKERLN